MAIKIVSSKRKKIEAGKASIQLQLRRRVAAAALTLMSQCIGVSYAASSNSEHSLVLEELISSAIYQHPLVRVEGSQGKAALEDLDAAKLRRYPTVSLQSETSGASPISILSAEQTLWSAGRAQALVDSAQATSELHTAQLLETQYQVALRVIDAWYSLAQAVARLQEIAVTQQKLDYFDALMKRRVAAEVSPKIEMELIASRRMQSRVDMQQARSAALTAQGKLEVLLGKSYAAEDFLTAISLEDQVKQSVTEVVKDHRASLYDAVDRHPSIARIRLQAQASQFDLKVQQAAQWPQVYMRLQKQIGGIEDPAVKSMFIGFKYEPGAGFSTAAQTRSVQARAEGYENSIDVVRRDLQDAINIESQDLAAARNRAEVLEQAVSATGLVQESYERQFVVGRRNWQEVMNAVRENNDIRLSLVDSRISILGAAYRLRVRMSDLSWQKESLKVVIQ